MTLVEQAPFGVIGSITPSTNPPGTVINNSISMIAAGNAVVFLSLIHILLAEKAGKTVAQMKVRLMEEADAIRSEDIQISRNIGKYGFELLEKLGKGVGIMTHCNAGTLATAKYGTALAPIYIALEQGWDGKKDLHVYCDETRPLLQGARLSAYEMQAAGVDTYVQCDNMASYTMKSGKIGIIFVGCDRVAANGDFANKIGTSGVAIIAKHYGIPFYCCAPSSTIDMTMESGDEIHIEQRKPEEVTEMWYAKRMAPEGVGVVNPAFDVTDHSMVTGIITEKGIAYPDENGSFKTAFEQMGIKPVELSLIHISGRGQLSDPHGLR